LFRKQLNIISMDIKDFLTTNNAPGTCDDRQSGNPPLVQMNDDDVTMDGNTNGCAFDQNVSNNHPYNNYQPSYQPTQATQQHHQANLGYNNPHQASTSFQYYPGHGGGAYNQTFPQRNSNRHFDQCAGLQQSRPYPAQPYGNNNQFYGNSQQPFMQPMGQQMYNYQQQMPASGQFVANPVQQRRMQNGYNNERRDSARATTVDRNQEENSTSKRSPKKQRKQRITLSEYQRSALENFYHRTTKYPLSDQVEDLSRFTGMTFRELKTWFKNRRSKGRNEGEIIRR